MPALPPARGLAVALAIAATLGACRGAPVATTPSPAAAPSADAGQRAAVARARADSLRRPYTAADVHFMTMMIGHHAQALEMARLVPTRDASPAVRTLAERIMNGQEGEIGTMQQWLRDREKPVPDPAAGMAGMAGHAHGMSHGAHHPAPAAPAAPAGAHHPAPAASPPAAAPAHLMPGMLSAAEMRELAEARGPAFDRLFLARMIQHHRGALAMVKELFGSYGAGEDETVFKFASDVNVDQATEIARMQRMLLELDVLQAP